MPSFTFCVSAVVKQYLAVW